MLAPFVDHVTATRIGMGNFQKIARFQSLPRRSIIYGLAKREGLVSVKVTVKTKVLKVLGT